jgi:hypothetical protein
LDIKLDSDLMVIVLGIFDKLFKKKEKPPEEEEYLETQYPQQDILVDERGVDYPSHQYFNEPSDLDMEPNIIYNLDGPEYRLKLRNKSIDVIGDITLHLRSQKKAIASLPEEPEVFEMLEPEKSTVMKIKIKPKYKPGKTNIYGRIEYFDFKSKQRKIVKLPQSMIDFDLDKLSPRRANEDKWRQSIGGLKNYELETEVLEIPPPKVFNVFKRVLDDIGLYMLTPIENVNLYRGIVKFYGNDKDKKIYAVEAQVIGDRETSKVLFRIWSSEIKDSMALAFKTFDAVENIIKIKKFIVET